MRNMLPLAAGLALIACHGDSSPVPTAVVPHARPSPAAPKAGATPQQLTAGMVEAATVGKSTAPVAVKFDLVSRPQIGQPLEVVLAILPTIAARPVTLRVTGTAGLQLPAQSAPLQVESVEPSQVYRLSVTVTPSAGGVQLLGLDVSLVHDEFTETRSFSIPLIVDVEPSAAARTASAEDKKAL